MASLKLDKKETAEMRSFYQTELEKTLKRLEHIKDVLDKLGDKGSGITIKVSGRSSSTSVEPTASLKTTNTVRRKRKSKPGPDSIWEKMVLKRLKAVDRPLTYEELTDEVMNFGRFPRENRKKVKQSVINVTFRLRKRDKKIDTFSNGGREKYLALRSWFDSPGVISDSYRDRTRPVVKTTKVKPKKAGKRGRPKGSKNKVKKTAVSIKKTSPKAKRVPGRPARKTKSRVGKRAGKKAVASAKK